MTNVCEFANFLGERKRIQAILKHSTNSGVEETKSLVFLSYNEGRVADLEKCCKKKRKGFNNISAHRKYHDTSKCIPVFLFERIMFAVIGQLYMVGDEISSSVFDIPLELATVL